MTGDQLVLFIEALDLLVLLIDRGFLQIMMATFELLVLLQGFLESEVVNFDVFVDMFGDVLAQRGEFHVDVDKLLGRQGCDFEGELLGGGLSIKERVEMRVKNDFLLPVLHRLLVFINTHLNLINNSLTDQASTILTSA